MNVDRQRRGDRLDQRARRRRKAPAGNHGQDRRHDPRIRPQSTEKARAFWMDRRQAPVSGESGSTPQGPATPRRAPVWSTEPTHIRSRPARGKPSSCTVASKSPVSTTIPTTGTAAPENRFKTASRIPAGRRVIATSGTSAPTQKSHADAVQEDRWPHQPLRRSGAGMAARRQRQTDPHDRRGRQCPGRASGTASQRDHGSGHRRDGDQQRRKEAGGHDGFPGRDRCQDIGRRTVQQIEALKSQRGRGAEETDEQGTHRSRPRPGSRARSRRRKYPADAREQPEINTDPRQPDQRRKPGCAVAPRGNLAAGHTKRKYQRSSDRMSIRREDAIADELGAARKVIRQADFDGVVMRAHLRVVARPALAVDEPDDRGSYGLVEPQAYRLRRLRHHAAVAGLGRNQRCMARMRRWQNREPTAGSPGRQ